MSGAETWGSKVFTARPSRQALDRSEGGTLDGTGQATVRKGGLAIMLGGDRDGTRRGLLCQRQSGLLGWQEYI